MPEQSEGQRYWIHYLAETAGYGRVMSLRTHAGALGRRIKKLRLERGLSQAQLAEPELSSAYISLIESGDRQPSDRALAFIAERLGLTLDELASGSPAGFQVEVELRLQRVRCDVDEGRLDDAQATLSDVLRLVRRHKLKRAEARALELVAAITEKTDGPQEALRVYEQAENLWADDQLHLRFVTVTGIARCTHQLGDAQMALHILDSYRHQLEASEKPDPLALMQTYTATIYPAFAAGLPHRAAQAAREALALEARVDDPDHIACMHLTVARSLLYDGHHADALASIRRAEEIYLQGGWRNRLAKAHIAEAIVLAKKEDYEPARDKLQEALGLLRESPNRLDEALALNELGHVMRHLDDLGDAISYLQRASKLLAEADVIEKAFNERELGLCLGTSNAKVAERHLKRAIDLYRISGASAELATTFKALGDLYGAQGKTDLALQALRDGISAVEERAI